MKRLLPILTLALLGVATTASAEFYYDYYQNPGKTDVGSETWKVDDWNTYETKTDTFTYNNFEVTRYSLWTRTNNGGEAALGQSNFYRIHVLGD